MGECVLEPYPCPVVAPTKEVDVAQFGACLRHRDLVVHRDGDPIGLVQYSQPFLVETSARVDQSLGKNQPGIGA